MTQSLQSHGLDLRAALLLMTVAGLVVFVAGLLAGFVAARLGPFHNAML